MATPATTAWSRPPRHVSDPAGPATTARFTDTLLAVATLPPASRIVTTGCETHAAMAVPPPGWPEKTIETPMPATTSKSPLVPGVRPVAVAISW